MRVSSRERRKFKCKCRSVEDFRRRPASPVGNVFTGNEEKNAFYNIWDNDK